MLISRFGKITALRRKIIPDYAVLPLILLGVYQLFGYYSTKLLYRFFTGKFIGYHNVTLPFEASIPTVPLFVTVYFLSFLFWAAAYVAVAHFDKKTFYRLFIAEMCAKTVCFIIFTVFPTALVRPAQSPDVFGKWMIDFLWMIDEPNNIFPSMHCLFSWFAARYLARISQIGKTVKAAAFIFTFLIFASVLFTKQHVVIDIFGGVLLAEATMFVSERVKPERFMKKLDIGRLLVSPGEAESEKGE